MRFEGVQERADACPCGLNGSLGGFSKQELELGEDLLDRIEVGTVWRQEEQPGADGTNGAAYCLASVAAEIVDDDDVSGSERRNEQLFHIGQEAFAVDGPVNDTRGIDPVVAQRRQEGQRSPVPLRSLGQQLASARRPTAQARHVGFGPGLVDEDQTSRIKPPLILLPPGPTPCHVGTILLGGEQSFF